jgi:hypothetical protein
VANLYACRVTSTSPSHLVLFLCIMIKIHRPITNIPAVAGRTRHFPGTMDCRRDGSDSGGSTKTNQPQISNANPTIVSSLVEPNGNTICNVSLVVCLFVCLFTLFGFNDFLAHTFERATEVSTTRAQIRYFTRWQTPPDPRWRYGSRLANCAIPRMRSGHILC